VFGMVDAFKEDLAEMRQGLPGEMTAGLRARLGLLIQQKGDMIDMSVPADWFQHLQKEVLIKNGYAWVNDFNEFRLTTAGVDKGIEEAKRLHKPLALRQQLTPSNVLQRYVRDMRADLDTMMRLPSINKWWWRGVMWNFRRWWAGTNPEQKRLSAPVEAREPWTAQDEERVRRQWVQSHYTAFWLCPAGVEAGLEKLNEFDAKKAELGPHACQVIDAVESIARHCALLPVVQPMTVIEQIQNKMFDKSGDFKVEELQDKMGNVTRISWQGSAGAGKTYGVSDMTSEQLQAFISIHDGKVEATEAAKKLADIQAGRDFDEVTRKPRLKKPKQFVLFDQFKKAMPTEVPYRVGIPIENPCYLHAHECDCGRVLPSRQTYVPMPPVKKPKRPPPSVK
jgi:hypothetical protein